MGWIWPTFDGTMWLRFDLIRVVLAAVGFWGGALLVIGQSPVAPPLYLGEPASNAGTSLLADRDGSIVFIYREGDHDKGGFSNTVFYRRTEDEGRTWSDAQTLLETPGNPNQCFSTISPQSGEVILFYIDRGVGIKSARSFIGWQDWTIQAMSTADQAPINTISYANAVWVDLPGGGKRVICGFHCQEGLGSGTFYSDDDGRTWSVSPRITVANTVPNIWQTGAVEPTLVELSDGRMLMFIRNSNFQIWKSYSLDQGATWTVPVKTDLYCGDNSWITLKKLADGRIVLVWNNAKSLRPEATLDKWSFTGREVLHMAISEDDGETWLGFRELMLDRLRDGVFINYPGDKGLNESKVAETRTGKLLMALGQAPGHRSFVLVDPDWIYERSRQDDFSAGTAQWSRQKLLIRPATYSREFHHNFERKPGAEVVPHPDDAERNVLHLRRPPDETVFSQRDGAVWNFPAGRTGFVETTIRLNEGFKGASIALNDRWFQPIDNQGRETAMYVLDIPESGRIGPNAVLQPDQWHTLRFEWHEVENPDSAHGEVFLDQQPIGLILPLRNPSPHGISYLRLRSASRWPDENGLYLAAVRAMVR